MSEHKPEPWFWDTDSGECLHDPEPEDDMSDEWAGWADRHPTYDNGDNHGHLCLDAPMGEACGACSEETCEFVAWKDCVNTYRTAHGIVVRNRPENPS